MEKQEQKIGILTFHRTTNFGSVLQTYGLYKKIETLGYLPEIIDYRCPAIERREQLERTSHIRSIKGLAREIVYQPTIKRKGKELFRFEEENMRISNPYFPNNVSDSEQFYSKIIVGSDIVWGMDITEGDETYFLNYIKENSKKYAFSSSVGHLKPTERDLKVEALLKDFSQIAVREEDGASWVEAIVGYKPPVVCDPTMLLTVDEWEKIIPPKKIYAKYVLVYFDNDNHKCSRDAYEYAKKNGLIPYFINYGRSRDGLKSIRPTTLNEFLGLVKYADTIFTSSYHGFLFSLYFHKRFVFYTRVHKSRVLDLQNRLNLNRCGDDSLDFLNQEIDYLEIDKIIQEFRENSTGILRGMLKE